MTTTKLFLPLGIFLFVLLPADNLLSAQNQQLPLSDWEAHWIWLDEKEDSDVMLARRSFELPAQSAYTAEIRITASSQYQLYLNGQYVRRGPARSAPHHQFYDVLDVSAMLRSGKNTIAIRVHHQKNKHAYQYLGRAGLLAQLDIPLADQQMVIATNETWKAHPDPSWDNEAPVIGRFQMVVNDRVDLRQAIKNWQEMDCEDASWPNARALMREVGWPGPQKNASPQVLTPPWLSLHERDVPYLIESYVPAIRLIEAKDIGKAFQQIPLTQEINKQISKQLTGDQEVSKALALPPLDSSRNWFLLFDLGRVMNGFPILDIEGMLGHRVDVLSAAFVVDNVFSYHLVDSDFRDQIILSGEKDQWEATYFKPARYLGLVVQGGSQATKLHAAGLRRLAYPFQKRGYIRSSDAPWIASYMQAAEKTIEVCTTDGYTDNYRERRQYAQTGFYAALGNYWTFGDHALQRRYLIQVAQEQQANGMMPAYAPLAKDDYMIILDSNCLWIRSLWHYFLYSGDEKTVRELLPAARKLMALLHSFSNASGAIDNPPYPYWLDHALNDRRGANVCLNGHYLGALEDFSQLLHELGEAGSLDFHQCADRLRQSLRSAAWDEDRQLFADAVVDGKPSTQFSEHANAMALAMHIASPAQAKAISTQVLAKDGHNFIKRANGMTVVTPAMSYFLHKGLCEAGYVDESFEMFRHRFDRMLEPERNGTLWEEWWLDGTGRSGKLVGGRTRSDAQTESAFPPALFGEYLVGVRVLTAGMKEVGISRPASQINHIEANIPSPEGNLMVEWKMKGDKSGELILTVPGEMKVRVSLAEFGTDSLTINGRMLDSEKEVFLEKGEYRLVY